MLKRLYIRNFTLIDTLDIEFHSGFSVITGETGAGKSIILGAIGLLLGQRADSKTIKQGADKCVIEAHFGLSRYDLRPFFDENDIEYDADDCIVRRELTAAGKSRSFINDTPVPLSLLKELGERLVDVHSQHQNLLLNKQDFQLNVVDILASGQQQTQAYQEAFSIYQETARQLEALQEEISKNRQNADFLQFQLDELTNARLVEGEQEELEQTSATMTHAEDIKSALYEADNAFMSEQTGIIESLSNAIRALGSIGKVFPAANELAQRLDSSYIELKDISMEINSRLENVDFDPSKLDAINTRLDQLYGLLKKYHMESVAELIGKREELQEKVSQIENSDEALAELQEKLDQTLAVCQKHADTLTALREKAARKIEKEMRERLIPLGMPNVRFEINIERKPLSQTGQDKVSFLFSANTSTPLLPVSQVASGGEIARVMLALKAMVSGAVKLPTIIFDEIDTGVSGKIAEQMAHIMREMGESGRQVISITHLPQIAALGSTHYKVQKEESAEGTKSNMTLLSPEQRIQEIAQMLSGSDISDAAIQNAKTLLRI